MGINEALSSGSGILGRDRTCFGFEFAAYLVPGFTGGISTRAVRVNHGQSPALLPDASPNISEQRILCVLPAELEIHLIGVRCAGTLQAFSHQPLVVIDCG